ncbi:MAG: tetratricopeptide repeat protein, partial [Planctomycetaceae bacterium]
RVADAKLGAAWAAAFGAESSTAAATRLQAFVEEYPDHRDAPHALRASATCLDQADQAEQAEAVRSRLLESYPQSDAATAVLARYGVSETAWPEAARDAWRARMEANAEARATISSEQATAVFAESLRSSDNALWHAALQWLISTDSDGSHTDAILTRCTTGGHEPLAEHLAVDLIALAGAESGPQSPAASEAACRWAGASERWSMLALAADELGAPSEKSHRSPVIDRLLAESLIQTQRPAESLRWWDWLIDERDADDFATLLRAAETTVAHGKTEAASSRLERAKLAAGEDAFHLALVQILAAELSIRRARFDEARETLSEVVSGSDAAPALRPRAQWMIGETYFLQQRFAEAIDAYRRVDAMDAAGEWAPAALLQAGKAFEKLGRGRDAAVCYTALLTRFRDWPHANFAQSRLASLSPTSTAPASVLR